jgi:hypothetical protein
MKRQTWQSKVREVYSSLDELRAYDDMYCISKRCGFTSPQKLWKHNPLIGGSVNPEDFGLAT